MAVLLRFVIFLMCSISYWDVTVSNNIPSNACTDYFEYIQQPGNKCIGLITLRGLPKDKIAIEVVLCQDEKPNEKFFGRISFFNITSVNKQIEPGEPVQFRVDFPIANVNPTIEKISVNSADLCSQNQCYLFTHKITLKKNILLRRNKIGCIKKRDVVPDTNFPSDPFKIFPFNQPRLGPPPPLPLEPSRSLSTPGPNLPGNPANSVCGRENYSDVYKPLIYENGLVRPNQYPWLAAVYEKTATKLSFLCGASLISASTLITAAHCFNINSLTARNLVVGLGRHDLKNFTLDGSVFQDVKNLFIHPNFNERQLGFADVAILQLETPVSYTNTIRPICLWSNADNLTLVNSHAYVAGWGAEKNKDFSQVPKVVYVKILSENEIKGKLAESISNTTIWAINEDNTRFCKQTSGNGMMIPKNGVWLLRGIVSGGINRGENCGEIFYTDVAKYLPWVQRNISN